MPNFDRIYSLRVGKTRSGTLLEITGLRVVFRITKNLGVSSNTAIISIYNLSQDTRNKLSGVFDIMTMEAGYAEGDGLKLMFKGNIQSTATKRQGADLVTTILSGDGLRALIDTKFNKGYAAGTSAWTILDDILDSFDLPKKISDRLKAIARKKGKKYANAFTSAGSARKAMDRMMKKLDAEWSIQNGAIKVLELEDVDDSPVILLSPETGLIGLPIRINDLKKRQDTKKKIVPGSAIKNVHRKGWEVESLLLPEVEPGARLKVEEPTTGINGVFRVEELEHIGDNFGTNWTSRITVADLN